MVGHLEGTEGGGHVDTGLVRESQHGRVKEERRASSPPSGAAGSQPSKPVSCAWGLKRGGTSAWG